MFLSKISRDLCKSSYPNLVEQIPGRFGKGGGGRLIRPPAEYHIARCHSGKLSHPRPRNHVLDPTESAPDSKPLQTRPRFQNRGPTRLAITEHRHPGLQ